jgi:hypothetical protein
MPPPQKAWISLRQVRRSGVCKGHTEKQALSGYQRKSEGQDSDPPPIKGAWTDKEAGKHPPIEGGQSVPLGDIPRPIIANSFAPSRSTAVVASVTPEIDGRAKSIVKRKMHSAFSQSPESIARTAV